VAKEPAQDTFVEKLIANIIKNLEVTVTNIHIRFEDNVTNPRKPFSVGVTLHELSLQVSSCFILQIYCICLFIHLIIVRILLAVIYWAKMPLETLAKQA